MPVCSAVAFVESVIEANAATVGENIARMLIFSAINASPADEEDLFIRLQSKETPLAIQFTREMIGTSSGIQVVLDRNQSLSPPRLFNKCCEWSAMLRLC